MFGEQYQNAVMEVAPWTNERCFSGNSVWWDYVLSRPERTRLESLIGLALLEPSICDRLLDQHDDALLDKFDLSEETKTWLKMLNAKTLHELAEAIANSADAPIAVSCYSHAA